MAPFLDPMRGRRNRIVLLGGVIGAILLAVSLAAFKLVVLKMLPFDNKSEFQVVVNMPVGTPLEQTARVLREMGQYLQTVPEVTDYQAYAGTASPINFNGLVRQYYLRRKPGAGRHPGQPGRQASSRPQAATRSPARSAPELTRIGKQHGADVMVVEVPPGPPVLSPIVAEIYGPDYDGQMRVAKQVRAQFAAVPDIVGIADTVDANAPRLVLRVLQNKAALSGVAQKDIVETMRMGLSGEYVTPDPQRRGQVRDPGPADAAARAPERRSTSCSSSPCAAATATWCRCPSWSRWSRATVRRPSTTRTWCRSST